MTASTATATPSSSVLVGRIAVAVVVVVGLITNGTTKGTTKGTSCCHGSPDNVSGASPKLGKRSAP